MKLIRILWLSILLLALFAAGTACANPIWAYWFIRDTPLGAPNGIWDDQWSGGTVNPPGEIIIPEFPPEQPCGSNEYEATITRLGSGQNTLRAYTDPPFYNDETAWRSDAMLSLRQTCWEAATVVVTLYRVDADGGNPIFLDSTSQVVAVEAWPPTTVYFELDNIPQLPLNNQRFMWEISTEDGQCTDLVWDCYNWEWPCMIWIPARSLPAERISWGAVKAMY